ncbi:VPLPA-CTERM sorting domain-containing protein [Methylomonas sp. HW2-6]|uniref:VPLPA-CTERM sorting domain-containing protein n=1 Tax=Methylomonas sp. HW2-6 TaxID=3376687 RepID=UPI004042D92D
MKHQLFKVVPVIATAMLPFQSASAHVNYYDLFNNVTTQVTSTATSTTYSGGDVLKGNFGWGDATDVDWGDSHMGSWIRFSVSQPAGVWVSINVASDGINQYVNNDPNNPSRLGDLKPGFSLYRGLVPDEAHDGATAGFQPGDPQFGKEGAWRALADTTMGNDNGDVATIEYLAHAGSVNGSAASVSLLNFFLTPGDYTLAIGGSCYDQNQCVGAFNIFDPNADETARGYKVSVTVSSVAPVPLPAAAWLMISGLIGVLGLNKRRLPAA